MICGFNICYRATFLLFCRLRLLSNRKQPEKFGGASAMAILSKLNLPLRSACTNFAPWLEFMYIYPTASASVCIATSTPLPPWAMWRLISTAWRVNALLAAKL